MVEVSVGDEDHIDRGQVLHIERWGGKAANAKGAATDRDADAMSEDRVGENRDACDS